MRITTAVLAAGLGLAAAGAAAAEPSVEIRRAAVRVVVVPEARGDIQVEVLKPNASLPLYVSQQGDHVVIDGGLSSMFTGCRGSGANLRATVFGKGDFSVDQLPQIIIKTPMDVRLGSGGVVVGSIGRAHSVDLSQSGCGGWTVANVEDRLEAHISGAGDIETGSAARAELNISGSGRMKAGPVRDTLEARVSGSGRIETASAGSAELTISGSGNMRSGPVTGGLTATISGSGDLDVARVDGPFRARVSGVGHIRAPAGQVTVLQARIGGAGGVTFGGVAQTLDAQISGSGDVRVAQVTGEVSQHVSGAGQVHIDGR
jgi:hypothetical protein